MEHTAVRKLEKESRKFERLLELMSDQDKLDEELIIGTMEGETDLEEAIYIVSDEIAEREAQASVCQKRIEGLGVRARRHQKAADTLKTIILNVMDKAGIKTLKGADATITVKATPQTVVIEDEALLPSKFFKKQAPKLDKRALKAALGEGEVVEGAALSNGGIALQIRRA